ncbi:hypothetical protein [Novosphingobium sp. B1]|nr:hypothetical protein [Novosphingobium sp. B1]
MGWFPGGKPGVVAARQGLFDAAAPYDRSAGSPDTLGNLLADEFA